MFEGACPGVPVIAGYNAVVDEELAYGVLIGKGVPNDVLDTVEGSARCLKARNEKFNSIHLRAQYSKCSKYKTIATVANFCIIKMRKKQKKI